MFDLMWMLWKDFILILNMSVNFSLKGNIEVGIKNEILLKIMFFIVVLNNA